MVQVQIQMILCAWEGISRKSKERLREPTSGPWDSDSEGPGKREMLAKCIDPGARVPVQQLVLLLSNRVTLDSY